MANAKIFGIGLSKTGTSSLSEALEILGYSTVHFPSTLSEIAYYDAATDSTVARRFEYLDGEYPGSKFIYTVRERGEWLSSCKKYYEIRKRSQDNVSQEIRQELFGTTGFDWDLFIKGYEMHEKRVQEYFAKRPNDWIALDVCGKDARWDPLCTFLNVAVPEKPFPKANKGVVIDELVVRLLHVLPKKQDVADIANMPVEYAEGLCAGEACRTHDPERPLEIQAHPRIDKILARACGYFGSAEATAGRMKMSRPFIEDARRRHWRRKLARRLKRNVPLPLYRYVTKLRHALPGAS